MEYLKSFTDGIIYSYETYFDKAERLKCERCRQMPKGSCYCVNCINNSYIINTYYNSMEYDNEENKIKSAKILQMALPQKISSAVKEIDIHAKYTEMLVNVNTFLQNNPQDTDGV
jgi:hypothetical protein